MTTTTNSETLSSDKTPVSCKITGQFISGGSSELPLSHLACQEVIARADSLGYFPAF